MTKSQIIQTVRAYIANANTSKALQALIAFLSPDAQYQSMEKVARLAQAKYERTERDFNQGLIDQETANISYNAINRTVLQLVEDIENNDFEIGHYEIDMHPKNAWQKRLTTALIGIFIVLASGLGYWIYTTTGTSSTKLTCPEFKDNSEFNVLLLPFQPNKKDELTPHTTIKRRLTDKSESEQLNTSIEIDLDYFEQHDTPGKGEAMEAGNDCGAQLVIWGIWEKIPNGTIISTDFKYLGNREQFGFQKLKLESDDQLDTVFAISNIETEGHLTEDIEKIIDNYFGLIAGLSGQPQAAVNSLKNAVPSTTDTSAFLLNQMTLANSYLAMGKNKAASEVYDNILEVHPNYGFARNNRGVLKYKEGEYASAVEDMTVKLEKTPNDADALVVRASAYIKQEQLKKAAVDLERASIIKPNKLQQQQINEKTILLEEKKSQKRAAIENASKNLEYNKNSLQDLNDRADAYKSLGDNTMAIQDAKRAIQLNNKNAAAYQTLIEVYANENDMSKAETILRQAQSKGVVLKDIKKNMARQKRKEDN